MTLHEAIEKVLYQNGSPMTTQQIADELNGNGWYKKKDGSMVLAYQIHGRTRNCSNLFNRDGSVVSLTRQEFEEANLVTKRKQAFKPDITEASNHVKISFPPISDSNTAVLILGTLPGDKSLEIGEYYGHSRNKFWKIISSITNNSLPLTYADKKDLLLKVKIGVWDVAHNAIRHGSLDSAISKVNPNDLEVFVGKHKNLKAIGFNGKKAEALYDKYFERVSGIKYLSLPSTSPANTGTNFENICKKWQQILIK